MRGQRVKIQGVDGAGEGEVGGLDKLGPEVAVRFGALYRSRPLSMAYFFVVCHNCRDSVGVGWRTGVFGGGRGKHVVRGVGRLSVSGRGSVVDNRYWRPRSLHLGIRDILKTCMSGLPLLYRARGQCFRPPKGWYLEVH